MNNKKKSDRCIKNLVFIFVKKNFNTLFTIKTQIVQKNITFVVYIKVMKTQNKKIKMVNGNRSFPTLSISQQTAEEMLTVMGVVALVAAVLTLPVGIFLFTYGL